MGTGRTANRDGMLRRLLAGPAWRAFAVWLMALALVAAQTSLAAASTEGRPVGAPCQMLPCHPGAPESAAGEGGASPQKQRPTCPMMRGALCLSICAATAPGIAPLPAPEEAASARLWFRDAAALPHVVRPPQRPPKSL